MNVTLIVIIAAVVIIAVMVVLILVMQNNIQNNMQNSVQTSVSNLGDMIYRNQQEASQLQSTRISEQNSRLNEQNQKISEMNRQFTEAMANVNRSLGEMQNLSSGVEDLKKIMSNVKSRGIMGELQLGAILEDILAPGQYEENVAVKGDSERVEFAVKFPGEEGRTVYLPIDSKFPGDAYLNLLEAYDTADRNEIKQATDKLRQAITKAAKDIRTKYIYPPLTTEFGIMFLPFEGLYAEVLRLNMIETLQKEYRVNVAGPTTMAAMLNSFRMGFKSIALQERSTEVWDTLEKAKTEFEKFNDVLVKTQTKLEQTQHELETLVGTRTRAIQRVLKNVSEMTESTERTDEE